MIENEVIPGWMNDLALDLKKPPTLAAYQQGMKFFISWLKDRGIESMKASDIKSFRNELNKSYAPKTVNLYLTGVRSFFAYCVTSDLLPSNPAREVSSISIDESFTRRALSVDEVQALFSAADDLRTRAIITLMLYCGLRRVEIHRLDLEDIDISAGRVKLNVLGKGKNNKQWINVPLAHAGTIINWYEYRKPFNTCKALFISFSDRSLHKRLSTRSISDIVTKALKAAGIYSERVTVHSLRHTAITRLVQVMRDNDKLDILKVQRFARHKNIKDTQRYIHLEEDSSDPACDMISY